MIDFDILIDFFLSLNFFLHGLISKNQYWAKIINVRDNINFEIEVTPCLKIKGNERINGKKIRQLLINNNMTLLTMYCCFVIGRDCNKSSVCWWKKTGMCK